MSIHRVSMLTALVFAAAVSAAAAADDARPDNVPPEGFVALFNGRNLDGWVGLPVRPSPSDPTKLVPLSMPERLSLPADELAAAQKLGNESARKHWRVEDGVIIFDGMGQNLCTDRDYGDFELLIDWKIEPHGDSGIYLRGSPQIQIWDPAVSPKYHDEIVGSGGIYNNQNNPRKATKVADRPVGEWNTFHIRIVGDKVTVKLNGETVVDGVTMENYWDKTRSTPLYPRGTIELQNHGDALYFKNIYVKELK